MSKPEGVQGVLEYEDRGRGLPLIYFTYLKRRLPSLWRGKLGHQGRVVPYAAIQFSAHEEYKRILAVLRFRRRSPASGPPRRCTGLEPQRFTDVPPGTGQRTDGRDPKECLHIRQQIEAVSSKHLHVFISISQKEGLKTLYPRLRSQGSGGHSLRPPELLTYETLKSLHREPKQGKTEYEHSTAAASSPTPLSADFGACAGLIGQSASYPLDVVRRRMQTAGVTGHQRTSIVRTMHTIVGEEGVVRGPHKGLSRNWLKGPIAVGISFTTFDLLQILLRHLQS
ncbi:Mitochondrial coenzyme A transporter SLC25A42 [Camelus dromedarius]|uniref:Mitochondrial coenzyme A transporter SLC25A42 n=1 Tax=Camelus dromedarius TaxID=9838 RepID=A0A5N4CME2_CAMDR|nr:Mitochondrial coenzyme A transporter SLC25A42 [Camelus dromedarius]